MQNKLFGFILPTFLLCSAIFALCITLISYNYQSSTRRLAANLQSLSDKITNYNTLIDETAKNEINYERVYCTLSNDRLFEICKLKAITAKSELILNFAKIFGHKFQCKDQILYQQTQSSEGFNLTPESARSKFICSHFPASTTALDGNLEINSPATFSNVHNTIQKYTIIAASGYIDINSDLKIVNDTVIIAGGDLHVKNLIAATNNIKVTLISASGSVVLDQITGAPLFSVFARNTQRGLQNNLINLELDAYLLPVLTIGIAKTAVNRAKGLF